MFDFGWAELLIIGAIALFVIRPQDIPKIAYSIGSFIRRLKYFQYAMTSQFDDFMAKAESKEKPKEDYHDDDDINEAEADAELLDIMPLPEDKGENQKNHDA